MGKVTLTFVFTLLFTGLISFWASALDLSRIDLSHQYDPDAPVKATYRVTESGGKITIFLLIQADSIGLWTREYLVQKGYSSEDHQNIFPTVRELFSDDQTWRGSISFTTPKSENLLILKLGGTDFNFYFDIPIKNGRDDFSPFYPSAQDQPIISSFLNTNKLDWNVTDPIHTTSYTENFDAADAPMNEMKALMPNISEDSTFFYEDSTRLQDYHFYTFRVDSTSVSSITLLKTPPYYPTFRLISELMGPMKYITTEIEFKTLTQSNRPKRTFDEFWINTYGTKFRARNAIRKYYKSVEYANEYFTSFKQGWKTDRGMIFVVYGTPLEMYRTNTTETWVYEKQEFEFLKISTLFAPIFALRKDKKYEKDWYKEVGSLRKGE
ncbi:MAG: GWxTD domain-containing protein [Cytophagales bacterium]|nr:GWxTD domain-containing protein [Cytophagales bacterium]